MAAPWKPAKCINCGEDYRRFPVSGDRCPSCSATVLNARMLMLHRKQHGHKEDGGGSRFARYEKMILDYLAPL